MHPENAHAASAEGALGLPVEGGVPSVSPFQRGLPSQVVETRPCSGKPPGLALAQGSGSVCVCVCL